MGCVAHLIGNNEAANVHLLRMRSFIALTVAFIGIAQASGEQRNDKILIQGNAAGMQTEEIDATGTAHVEYSYNDRGRGDHMTATWKLDAAGVQPNTKATATIT